MNWDDCHLPSAIRIPLHRAAVQGLKSGGVFVLEGFSKEQLAYRTGGPQSLDMLMSLDDLRRELAGLEFVHAVRMEREVREGRWHTGMGIGNPDIWCQTLTWPTFRKRVFITENPKFFLYNRS